MKPEEIDKLFNQRLKHNAPAPPADLWNRLQDRMEAELPQQEEKPARSPFLVWINDYAAAAVVTLLLTVGLGFYLMQAPKPANEEKLAQVSVPSPVQLESRSEENLIAAAQVQEPVEVTKRSEPVLTEARPAANAIASASVPKNTNTQLRETKPVQTIARTQPVHALAANNTIAQKATEPDQPTVAQPEAPIVLASAKSNLDASPVEIVIKRSASPVTASDDLEQDFFTGMDKKQRLAKNIVQQVSNLSNGERVDLSEFGINANKIALETHIGKQKISKVINL